MKNTPAKKVKKATTKLSKKAALAAKKVTATAKKKTSKAKVKSKSLLGKARKKLTAFKKTSSNALHNAKDKVYATEEEILDYVKENPVKSVSALALAGLIAGFVSRFKK